MRIVNRKEFLQLPTPFMYRRCYKNQDLENSLEICLDNNVDNNDWTYNQVALEPEFKNCNERIDTIIDMQKGYKHNIEISPDNATRDGLYEDDILFAVYDKKDFEIFVKQMHEYLNHYSSF